MVSMHVFATAYETTTYFLNFVNFNCSAERSKLKLMYCFRHARTNVCTMCTHVIFSVDLLLASIPHNVAWCLWIPLVQQHTPNSSSYILAWMARDPSSQLPCKQLDLEESASKLKYFSLCGCLNGFNGAVVCVHTCVCEWRVWMSMSAHARVRGRVCVRVYIWVCRCVCKYMNACIWACACYMVARAC